MTREEFSEMVGEFHGAVADNAIVRADSPEDEETAFVIVRTAHAILAEFDRLKVAAGEVDA